jgi:hypothetical protein
MLLVVLAEPVVAHRSRPCRAAAVDVLAMQELQRHADAGELLVNLLPVRLRMHGDVLAATGEQPRVHGLFVEVGHVVPREAFPVRGVDDRGHRVA